MLIPLPILLQLQFPQAIINVDFTVSDHGEGPVINFWGLTGVAPPTVSQIADWQATPNIQAKYQNIVNLELNQPILLQLQEIDNKTIRSLRENDQAMLSTFTAQAVALRTKLLPTNLTAADMSS